jgi:hypothetical protein
MPPAVTAARLRISGVLLSGFRDGLTPRERAIGSPGASVTESPCYLAIATTMRKVSAPRNPNSPKRSVSTGSTTTRPTTIREIRSQEVVGVRAFISCRTLHRVRTRLVHQIPLAVFTKDCGLLDFFCTEGTLFHGSFFGCSRMQHHAERLLARASPNWPGRNHLSYVFPLVEMWYRVAE